MFKCCPATCDADSSQSGYNLNRMPVCCRAKHTKVHFRVINEHIKHVFGVTCTGEHLNSTQKCMIWDLNQGLHRPLKKKCKFCHQKKKKKMGKLLWSFSASFVPRFLFRLAKWKPSKENFVFSTSCHKTLWVAGFNTMWCSSLFHKHSVTKAGCRSPREKQHLWKLSAFVS